MGADMLVAAIAIKKEDQPNFEAGKEFIKKLTIDDDLAGALVNEAYLPEDEYFDEDGNANIEEIRTWLTKRVEEFGETINSRYVTSIGVRDLWVYITGGLSWGDVTDECEIMWSMAAIPGLLDAMGFVEDYWDVDKTVTPEEEKAAVESIKAASP